MKAFIVTCCLLCCSAADAQQTTPPAPVQVVPLGPPVQHYAVVPQPGVVLHYPCCHPRPRGVWGLWPIPIPLGYYW